MIPHTASILVVGAASHDPAVYTYAPSFYRAFKKLGYSKTTFFNLRASYLPFINCPTQLPRAFTKINEYAINYALIQTVKRLQPDLIFFIKANTIFPETIHTIKTYGKPHLVHFYPDNPFVFWNGNSNERILKGLPLFDTFLSWSEMLIEPLLAAGCKQVLYFPFAFDEDIFKNPIIVTADDHVRFASDVCFIGSWDRDREQWLTDLAAHLPSLSYALWGNGWATHLSQHSPLRKHLRGAAIYGRDMIKAFRLSSINLNFIRTQNMTSHNMRSFEIPASHACMLTQRTIEQAKKLFTEGKNCICFESLEELSTNIVKYLNNSEEREIIIEQAWQQAQRYTLKKELNKLMLLL